MTELAKIAALDAGTYFHHRSLNTPEFAPHFHRTVYLPELTQQAIDDCDVLIVSCSSPPLLLQAQRDLFAHWLSSGRTLVAMGANQTETWLDGVEWIESPVNFWWWKEPGADSGLRLVAPGHPLFKHISLADATWHQHGSYRVPLGAQSLIDKLGYGSVLYEDTAHWPGRLIVSALDPMYHHGSHFMPAATRFLRGLLPWLREPWRSTPCVDPAAVTTPAASA
ncbi:MAG: hypothetical protein LBP52_10020 [Burkholderiaceae bacterium]|jgi:hypothetical protein|nr:hypothetical protein [Burkholderiaceae bacterium]